MLILSNEAGRGTIGGHSLSAPIGSRLALDTVARLPGVATTTPHESRSDRYGHVTTLDVLRGLESDGFEITRATARRTRAAHRDGHQAHLITLRRAADNALTYAESVPELSLLNSSDGTTAYKLLIGSFRLRCWNGLITGTSYESISIAHTRRAVSSVRDAAARIVGQYDRLASDQAEMQSRQLSRTDQESFAYRAMSLRFGADESAHPFDFRSLLAPRRESDIGDSLWLTLNRVQESVIRGGQRGVVVGSNGRPRRTTARGIRAIDSNVSINRALWGIAESYLTPRPMIAADYTVDA
jgi:hypothetical protein